MKLIGVNKRMLCENCTVTWLVLEHQQRKKVSAKESKRNAVEGIKSHPE